MLSDFNDNISTDLAMPSTLLDYPATLADLRESGWQTKTVKQEIHDNFLSQLQDGKELYPGIIGYDDSVIPELNIAILAQHDILFLGEKGQAKSRLMRLMSTFLDEAIPFIADPEIPLHDDPYRPITRRGRQIVATVPQKTSPLLGGDAKIVMPRGYPLELSLPTSSGKSIRPSSPRV